jgi:hypothetical protein
LHFSPTSRGEQAPEPTPFRYSPTSLGEELNESDSLDLFFPPQRFPSFEPTDLPVPRLISPVEHSESSSTNILYYSISESARIHSITFTYLRLIDHRYVPHRAGEVDNHVLRSWTLLDAILYVRRSTSEWQQGDSAQHEEAVVVAVVDAEVTLPQRPRRLSRVEIEVSLRSSPPQPADGEVVSARQG